MPTYEYQCDSCGRVFEVFQSITAEPLRHCNDASCNGPVRRLFSPGAGFLFKGSGFYSTDYRSDSYKKAASSDSSGSSSTESKSPKPATPASSSS